MMNDLPLIPQNLGTADDIERLHRACISMLRRRAASSAVATAVPLPGLDVLTDVGLMIEVLPKITRQFGLEHDQVQSLDPKTLATVLRVIQSLGPTLVGKVVTKSAVMSVAKAVGFRVTVRQVAKYVPIIGTTIAAALSYTAFMHIGKQHIAQCASVRRAMLRAGSGKPP